VTRFRFPLLGAVLLALLVAACSSSDDAAAPDSDSTTPVTTVLPAPEGLPEFYAVPQPLPAQPGALIKSEEVPVAGLHGTMHRVMYVSRSQRGEPVAVTGLVAVPDEPPPGGYRIVSWAHGTNGMTDECAPSLEPQSNIPIANALLDQGWMVTATDYQGEGTPGLHPYIAGEPAAHDTIDIVRAARALAGASGTTDYVVWGHSQGGHTAMHALRVADAYAPELDLRGVVAGAPPSQFEFVYNYLKGSPFKHYLLMAAGGLNAAYGDEAPLEEVLTPYGMSFLPVLEDGCAGYIAEELANIDVDRAVKADPFTVPSWKTVLQANDPQGFTAASPIPLLMIQGGNDEQIPVGSTQLLAEHLCSLDQDLTRWIYPGQSHAGVIGPSAADMIEWIEHRFAGGASPDPYEPTGQDDVQVTRCPAQ
jgi:pimeloyl-ACP methyl ester carboxylesterase